MRWERHVARMERGKVYTGMWWGEPEGKRQPLSPRLRPRWNDNIKIDIQAVGCERGWD